jgi:hypothetical protein
MPRMWFLYRRVRQDVRRVRSIKRSAFLLEDPRTFVILNVWEGEAGLLEFGTISHAHVDAARQAFLRARFHGECPEVWSTEWRIAAVSNNLSWGSPGEWKGLYPEWPGTPELVSPEE